jgi:hypothetical protein
MRTGGPLAAFVALALALGPGRLAQAEPAPPASATAAEPNPETRAAAEELRAAWAQLERGLAAAREAIDDPQRFAPPASPRTLAEGYRYLLGFLYGAVERALSEDSRFPKFRRALQPLNKATIDNADALYLSAAIDGDASYWVRGSLPPGWRGPRYVIFEAQTAYAGDSGSIAELRPGGRVTTGMLDSARIHFAAEGSFEILFAPERPADYAGDFLATRAVREEAQPDGAMRAVAHTARYVSVRELFTDWEDQAPLDLAIVRAGLEGAPQPAPTAAEMAQRVRRAGELVRNQMRFWSEFYARTLETYADQNGDGVQFMPVNALNQPAGAALATGGGQSTNVYAGGQFALGPNEALIVEQRVPVEPAYLGFHLANLWGESTDYANAQSSLNGQQAEWDADGVLRHVVAHRDPGVPNWLDTTGLPRGFLSLRWTYPEKPALLPSVTVTRVRLDEIRAHLPPQTRSVTPEERREAIRVRQEHVARRYRQY